MPSIVELQNRIVSLEGELSAITSSGEVSPEDAHRAAVIDGRLSEARDQLVSEAARVQAENERLAAEAAANHREVLHDMAHMLFGPKDSFGGIELGWQVKVSNRDLFMAQMAARASMMGARDAVSGLSNPHRYSTELPGAAAAPMGFIDTIPHFQTDGEEHYFQQPSFTNMAAGWASGNKAESSIEWAPAVALLETIAHYTPIAKLTARRYRQLESTVAGVLLLGLGMKKDFFALRGSNSSGIVGAMNQTGIQTYTQQSSGTMADCNPYDVAVEQKRLIRVNSGFTPDCVAMPSSVATFLKKAKGQDGHYMYPEIVNEGKLDGMTIVEDESLAVTTTSGGTTTTTNHQLCYFSGAMSWQTADEDEVTIGLIDKQFIQNTYSLLAEGTHSLKVPIPKAICDCAVSF